MPEPQTDDAAVVVVEEVLGAAVLVAVVGGVPLSDGTVSLWTNPT